MASTHLLARVMSRCSLRLCCILAAALLPAGRAGAQHAINDFHGALFVDGSPPWATFVNDLVDRRPCGNAGLPGPSAVAGSGDNGTGHSLPASAESRGPHSEFVA